MKCARYMATVAAGLLALSACSGNTVRDTLGLDRAAPDEFRVVSRPPLSVPPEFSLRPPSNNAQPANQTPTSDQAQSMLFGSGAKPAAEKPARKKTPAQDSAEAAFLKNAGADQADPQIRDKLAEQRVAVQESQESDSWWDIFSSSPPKKDTVVDAGKEAERIKKDENSDQPVTAGDTPVKKQTDTGVLGRLLGY